MSKHCQYHHNFAHTTEGCPALKDIMEELIQVRHLRKFVQTSTNSYRYVQRERYHPTEKNNTHGVEEKDHVILTMTNFRPNREEGVKDLFVELGHGVRVLGGTSNQDAAFEKSFNTIAGPIPLRNVGRREGRICSSPSLEN